jgi:2-amino-4-hydroxy-6-hydroxymethyldihydropteridine diphosphokinase
LDLDLIAFGSETCATPELIVPHPRAHQRWFVLQPLSEIAPEFVLPGQSQTVGDLLAALDLGEKVRRNVQIASRLKH